MSELDAIRAKRLAELSANGDLPNGVGGAGGAPGGSDAQRQQAQQQREDEEEARRQMLGQILDGEARERLNRIALVRPERSRAISELLIRMARSGQLRGKVTEQQLLSVLDQVEANERRAANGGAGDAAGKITFARRKPVAGGLSDSDDDDLAPRPAVKLGGTSARRRADDSDDDFDL